MKNALISFGSKLPGGLRDSLLRIVQNTFIRFSPNIKFGKNVIVPRHSAITSSHVDIGDWSSFSSPPKIKGKGSVKIGRYCSIGSVVIITQNHDYSRVTTNDHLSRTYFGYTVLKGKGDIRIGNDVWIGDGVMILPGVSIGDGAVIGAGAIVTKNIPHYSIAVGVPAKVVKLRFQESVARQLLEIAWWDWDERKIRRNREFFSLDASKEKDLKKFIVP